jgi:membrane protease YdiL (CAAX protease family)
MKNAQLLSRGQPPGALVARPAHQWPAALAILIVACFVSLFLAFTGQPVATVLQQWVGATDPEVNSALFSVYYLILGLGTTIWWPRVFGWQVGRIRQEWKLLAALAAVLTAAALVFAVLVDSPYRGVPWSQFTLVPITEEIVFRGLVFTGILLLLRRAGLGERSAGLAIAFNALAFGLAHSANYLVHPAGFVTLQIAIAMGLGAIFAYTRLRTGSIYPAIGLHALVNFLTNVL